MNLPLKKLPINSSKRKLLLSKWTAVAPENKEKHFLVTQLFWNEEENNAVCILEAVLTRSEYQLDSRELTDSGRWISGWR
jgi:tryptophan-rich hypothetical protein